MRSNSPLATSVNIRVSSAIVIVVVGVALVTIYWLLRENEPYRKLFEFAAAAVVGGAAIYSAHLAAISLRANVSLEKQRNAYHILEVLNEGDLVEVKNMLDGIITQGIPESDVYRLITQKKERLDGTRRLLGAYEDMAIAIHTGYADGETILRSSGSSIIAYHNRLRGFIKDLRKSDDQFRNYYVDLEALIIDWQARRMTGPARPNFDSV